jgi:outer membrane protein
MKFQKTLIASALMAAGLGLATSTYAVDKGDWVMRLGLTSINPNDGSSGSGGLGLASDDIGVDSDTQPSISFTYMYSNNVGVEILAALPFTHDVTLKGVGTIGDAEHLPPTVSLEYQFSPKSDVRPYVSAGINWTTILDTSTEGLGNTKLELDDSVGLALTAGVDVDINKDWFFNASVRYMNIETSAKLTGDVATTSDIDVEINPYVYTLGVGTTF